MYAETESKIKKQRCWQIFSEDVSKLAQLWCMKDVHFDQVSVDPERNVNWSLYAWCDDYELGF
jgi:hypothetical protein